MNSFKIAFVGENKKKVLLLWRMAVIFNALIPFLSCLQFWAEFPRFQSLADINILRKTEISNTLLSQMFSEYITRIINSKQRDSIDTWPKAGTVKWCLRMSLWILKHSCALFSSCTPALKFINIPVNSFLIHVNAWKISILCKMPSHNWVFQCGSTNIFYSVFYCLKICSSVQEQWCSHATSHVSEGQIFRLNCLPM